MRDPNLPVIDEVHDKLLAAFEQAESQVPVLDKDRRRIFTPLRVALASCLAVAALVAGALLSSRGDGGVLTVDQAIAKVAAASYTVPQVGPDQFFHVKYREVMRTQTGYGTADGKTYKTTLIYPLEHESWTSTRQTGLSRSLVGLGYFFSQRDRDQAVQVIAADKRDSEANARMRARHHWNPPPDHSSVYDSLRLALAGSPKADQQVVCQVDPQEPRMLIDSGVLPQRDPAKLPTDPKQIYDRLARRSKQYTGRSISRRSIIWNEIVWSLQYGATILRPEQRVALIRALGYIPGTTTAAETDAPNGARAILLSRVGDNQRFDVYFDRDNAIPIYTRTTVIGPQTGDQKGWPVGSVTEQYELLDQSAVDAPPTDLKPGKSGEGLNFAGGLVDCPPLRSANKGDGHYVRANVPKPKS
ncbi:MAG: hypothetical protein ACRDKI_04170 [Solirubrobacterales bacterium]